MDSFKSEKERPDKKVVSDSTTIWVPNNIEQAFDPTLIQYTTGWLVGSIPLLAGEKGWLVKRTSQGQ